MKARQNDLLRQFARGSSTSKASAKRIGVIYTRVSSYEQLGNTSLETQLKECRAFAFREGITITEEFGGTYESAKSDDERKEFKAMLGFLNRKRTITDVIVYDLSRFSRTGGSAIAIIDKLKEKGISVQAATQPADTDTAAGKMLQSMSLIYSHIDNQMKRERTLAGMLARMHKGGFCGRAPHGYTFVNGQLEPNDRAPIIKKIFHWKANDGMSQEEIRRLVVQRGWNIAKQSLSFILQNPVYCGLISHNLLNGELLPGKWKPLVSKELFLKANGTTATLHRYQIKPENEHIPLKRFMLCDNCGEKLRGYIVKAKNLWYYKCCTKGCSCNKSAKQLHELFRQELAKYTLPKESLPYVRKQLAFLLDQFNETRHEETDQLKRGLVEINKKIERIEEKFLWDEISKDLYEKHRPKLEAQRQEIERELALTQTKKSNFEKLINEGVEMAANLLVLWENGDFRTRQRLQKWVFPEGIAYSKPNNKCRTGKVNEVIGLFAAIKADFEAKKMDKSNENIDLSNSAPPLGLEPRTY